MADATLDLIDRLVAGGMERDDATNMLFRAFEERAKMLQDRFENSLSVRAQSPWVDGWMTAAEHFGPMDGTLYGPGNVLI